MYEVIEIVYDSGLGPEIPPLAVRIHCYGNVEGDEVGRAGRSNAGQEKLRADVHRGAKTKERGGGRMMGRGRVSISDVVGRVPDVVVAGVVRRDDVADIWRVHGVGEGGCSQSRITRTQVNRTLLLVCSLCCNFMCATSNFFTETDK